NPFFAWVNRLATRGIISGYACGGPGEPCDAQQRPYFRPNSNVTRGQTSKIVASTFFPGCEPLSPR
ncbi:MAG TPA: S-layer homology domain-containing protein, partial [Chloroflexia bacterium]